MDQALTKRGYARVIRDLAKSDPNDLFQEQLAQKKGPAQELAWLLQFVKLNGYT